MANELGKVRRSQNLTTYGPGAIIDFRTGKRGAAPVSAVAAGLEVWDEHALPAGLKNPQTTFEPRLQEKLRVDGFRLPPVTPDIAPGVPAKSGGKLIGVRFPTWLLCPKCHRLQPERAWDGNPGEAGRRCPACTRGPTPVFVIPVRFVAACDAGHLEDFPWRWWAHGGKSSKCTGHLTLKSEGGAGLGGLYVTCSECGARESMAGCLSRDALRGLTCRGKQPWLTADAPGCKRSLRGFQRGASNLYFPVIASSLDIPPFADRIQQLLGVYWEKVRGKATPAERRQVLEVNDLDKDTGIELGKLAELVERRIASLGPGGLATIRDEEFRQFIEDPPVNLGEAAEFEVRRQAVPAELKGRLSSLVQATRLREVRALRAFTRVRPPDPAQTDPAPSWAPISGASQRRNWLPAIEVRGEGIFLELDRRALADWEATNPEVTAFASAVHAAYEKDWKLRNEEAARTGGRPPRTITARFLVVHSLAHALIRQLGVDCGYSTASLRERLYVGRGPEEMAAMLIYTATPDSDGTLGGLASQAQTARFLRVFEAAIKAVSWCSSDPLCGSGVHAFTEPTNGAACHACMLAPETSCEEFNRFLDRRMLVGTPERPELGFLAGVV
jgi:hypothetical protein